MKKKTVSCMLALSLVASNIPVYANPVEEVQPSSKLQSKSTAAPVGNIEADINFALPIKKTTNNMKLTLKVGGKSVDLPLGSKEVQETGNVSLNGQSIKYEIRKLGMDKTLLKDTDSKVYFYNVIFYDLPCDSYSLELSGEGFKTVKVENIKLENYSKRVIMSNTESFLFGDFNDDGKVNDTDYELLLDNIETNDSKLIQKYDLNKDGVVDITDLSYTHDNLDNPIKSVKIEDTNPIVDTTKIKIEENEKQEVVGTIEDLFTENTSVKVTPKDDSGNPVEISEKHPAVVDMTFEDAVKMEEIVIDSPGTAAGKVDVLTEDGETISVPYGNNVTRNASKSTSAINAKEGTIQIDLGKQVAVKKVSIVITETTNNVNLAEIAKVEFLNNVYEEIPAPEMNIPKISKITPASEELTVEWAHEPNVTGYEVKAVGEVKGKVKEFILQTTSNTVTFTGLENYNEYKISIQSMNGEWLSGYSEEVTGTPKPTGKPEAPEGVSIEGLYKSLNVTWKKHKNADTFNLYYKEAGSEGEYTAVENLKTLSYKISNLEDDTEYEVYLTATNEHGTSGKSQTYKGKTMDLTAPITPNYKLINTPNGINEITNHITNVTYPSTTATNKFDIVDNDFSSSWIHKSWDAGGFNSGKPSPIVEFDQAYRMDTIVVTPDISQKYDYSYVQVKYWDESGKEVLVSKNLKVSTKTSSNGKKYYEVKLDEPITTNKIQVNFALAMAYGDGTVSISEMKFYNYDSLEDDVRALFKDDLLVELNEGSTKEKIEELRERANTIDSVSGEYHPYKDVILKEIDYAEQLLNDQQSATDVITVNQNITNSGNNLGMANDSQALGLSAKAGDEIAVYVGTKGNVLPQLVFTQHYAESGKYTKTVNLQKGRNVITVPKIHDMDVEKGGSLYIRYPKATPTNNEIKIRVSGATKIPHLNVYGMMNDESKQTEVKAAIKTYINELKTHVNDLPNKYKGEVNASENKYAYDERTSILNSTDIETDKVTLNLPATAILNGITNGLTDIDAQVDRVYKSLQAWEQLMDLKYAERGVSNAEGTDALHLAPKSRMNVKYQRMFIGAFMYASGNHVGIEYDSAAPLMQGKPFTFNEDGTVKDKGNLFGWGIAHEVGHVTDPKNMTYAETTNNVIALLAQTFDDEAESRLENSGKYEDIYEKVTSGTVSLPSDVFVKLGMFWQLHLAYDENPTAKMLLTDVDNDDTNDSFYARYSKRLREATAEENKLNQEQLLVRVASDAAGKDLSEFFYAWGIRPDAATKAYLASKGYEKETRKIQYLNDEARRQKLAGKGEMTTGTKVSANFANDIKANTIVQDKDITLNLGVNQDSDKVLGYEIYRNGKVIGFTPDNTFTDSLGATNNRVVKYEVVAYDYQLNATDKLDLGSIKVSHDGTMDKKAWAVETNTTNNEDKNDKDDIAHGPVLNPSINKVVDNKADTVYTGERANNQDPYVIVDMNESQPIVGIKYTDNTSNAIRNYDVFVSNDKENWTLANSGTFTTTEENPTSTVYFNKEGSTGGQQLWSYNASYVKLVAKGAKTISISELDIIAPPGDNIEIGTEDAQYANGIGTLKTDYVYDKSTGAKIPAGSIIVTGEYRGNPAFNVAILKDKDGNIVAGEQILLAEVPENAHLGEISKGSYIYWISPEDVAKLTSKVMVEMYRVNDAQTNEGQRLVSDSLYVNVPAALPEIEFNGGQGRAASKKSVVYNNKKMVERVASNIEKSK